MTKGALGLMALTNAVLVAGQLYAAGSSTRQEGWVVHAVDSGQSALAALEASRSDDPDAVIRGLQALAKARLDALQYAAAVAHLQRAVKLHKDAFKGLSQNRDIHDEFLLHVRLLSGLGDAQLKQGKLEAATESYEAGIHAARLGVRSASPAVKHLRTGLACVVARRSIKMSGESIFGQLLAASEQASGFVHEDVAMILNQWITYRGIVGELATCEEMAVRLVGILESVYGSDHPEVAEALNRQASILYEKGELERALPLLEHAYAIRRSAFGSAHEITTRALRNLGILQDELNLQSAVERNKNAIAPVPID